MRRDGAERVARNLEDAPAFWQADGLRFEVERAFEREHNGRFAACFDVRAYDGDTLIFRDRIECWDGIPGDVRADLTHTVRAATRRGPWVKDHPGTVSTFYSATSDANIQSQDSDWSAASGGTGGTLAVVNDTGAQFYVGGNRPGIDYELYEAFLEFDVSSLPDDDIVSDAVLSLMLFQDASTTDFTVEAREYDFGGTVDTGDWRNPTQLTALTLLATLATSGIGSTEAYKDFTDVALVDAVDPTGALSLVLCSSNLRSNTPNTGDEFVQFYTADETGTSKDPKLVVTHAPPPTYDADSTMEITADAVVSAAPAPQVATNLTLEVDWDGDGDFSEAVEDITAYVIDCQTVTGRDFASQLTGNASPGQLRAYLNNADGRFSSFKTDGALYETDGWLGRKVRLRDADVTPDDPVILARDRFNRADGSLGTAEVGGSWTALVAGLVIADQVVYSSGATDISTVDCGAADHFVQARLADPGTGNFDGIDVFARVAAGDTFAQFGLRSTNIAAGYVWVSNNIVAEFTMDFPYAVGTLIGIYAVDDVLTFYINGVPVGSLEIADTTATDVGIAVTKSTGDSAGLDDFLVLSHLETETAGVLWTGEIEYIEPSVVPGPFNTAVLSAIGPLKKLTEVDVTPPVYLDGAPTGHIVGAILNKAGVTLPGRIDAGQVTTGPYVRDESSALTLCRELEDVEIGFLHETHEGQIAFDSRFVRANTSTVSAVFSDNSAEPFALRYTGIRQLDWRTEVFNRVKASLSPYSEGSEATLYTDPGPYALASGESRELEATYSGLVSRWTGHTRDVRTGGAPSVVSVQTETFAEGTTTAAVDMPATVAADDLLLVVSTHPMSAAGWTDLGGYVYAKQAAGTEDGTSVNFTVASSPYPIVVHVFRIDDWPLSMVNLLVYDSGYWTNPQTFGGGTYYNEIRATFPWGATPSLVIATVRGLGIGTNPNVSAAPSGYAGLAYAELAAGGGDYSYLASAYKTVTAVSEKPGSFTVTGDTPRFGQVYGIRGNPSSETPVSGALPSGGSGAFTIGYDSGVGGTTQVHENIEVTGYPIVEGDLVTVQADDVASQDLFGIREYPASPPLFPNAGEAQLWVDTVLAATKDAHPLLELGFVANKSAAYMTQAMERRVGDRITVRAENNAKLGIDEDFFIESIEHRLSNGSTYHKVAWTLSPASVSDP